MIAGGRDKAGLPESAAPNMYKRVAVRGTSSGCGCSQTSARYGTEPATKKKKFRSSDVIFSRAARDKARILSCLDPNARRFPPPAWFQAGSRTR